MQSKRAFENMADFKTQGKRAENAFKRFGKGPERKRGIWHKNCTVDSFHLSADTFTDCAHTVSCRKIHSILYLIWWFREVSVEIYLLVVKML